MQHFVPSAHTLEPCGGATSSWERGVDWRKCIYYYTPLPLNLANKQATSKQQASNKHFSFLFWPLLRCIALGSTQLCGSQSPNDGLAKSKFSAKNSPLAPQGRGAKSGGAVPKLRIFCPKTAFFGPKRPQNPVITAKRRQQVQTLAGAITSQ